MIIKKINFISFIAVLFFCNITIAQKIELEKAILSEGLKVENCNEGGKSVGYITDGSHILIKDQRFSGSKKAIIRISSLDEGNKLTIHLGSLDSSPVAKVKIPATGGWHKWVDVPIKLRKKLNGKKDVYLKFSGNSKFLYNLNYIKFK